MPRAASPPPPPADEVVFDVRDWTAPTPFEAIEAYARAAQKPIHLIHEDFEAAFDILLGIARSRAGVEFG